MFWVGLKCIYAGLCSSNCVLEQSAGISSVMRWLCAAYVLGRQEEQHAPEEASDSLDVPSSPAPSEYGSHTSSLSRLR